MTFDQLSQGHRTFLTDDRRLVLGERTEEETEATLEALPAGARQVGFYSYGELSPFAAGRCDLHNQTMTLTTLWES